MTPRVLIGEVYRFLGEKLEFLWKESTATNTIHAADFAAGAVAIATWALSTRTSTVLSTAGETLPTTLKSNDLIEDVPGAARKEDVVRAVVFQLVDEGDTTQADIAKVIEEVVGVQAGFHGSIISSFAKLNMGDVLEDVNDKVRLGLRRASRRALLILGWICSTSRGGRPYSPLVTHPSRPLSQSHRTPCVSLTHLPSLLGSARTVLTLVRYAARRPPSTLPHLLQQRLSQAARRVESHEKVGCPDGTGDGGQVQSRGQLAQRRAEDQVRDSTRLLLEVIVEHDADAPELCRSKK